MQVRKIIIPMVLLVIAAVAFTGCTGPSTTAQATGTDGAVNQSAPSGGLPPGGMGPGGKMTAGQGAPQGGMMPGGNSTAGRNAPSEGKSSGGSAPGGSPGLSSYPLSGVYTIDGTTATVTGGNYTSAARDVSAVYVTNGGTLALNNPSITTSGETSSNDASSFYGLNAAVLATAGSTVTINGGTISTTGSGANGAFPTGTGSSIFLTNVTIKATGGGGHGVMATNGGSLTLTNVDIMTTGANGAPLATDRGSGTVTVTGGTVIASGRDSPGIYSTGVITVRDATVTATGSEAAVIEGFNSITLTNTDLTAGKGDSDRGIMIYQSMSGDADAGTGTFTMTGGSYTWPSTTGPAFFVTNTNAVITLSGVAITSNSDTLLEAAAARWGTSGSNGGTVTFTADNEVLTGSIVTDSISPITANLKNGTTLTGSIKSAALTLDATSTWIVTGDSALTSLSDTAGISGTVVTNIIGNGFTVTYDKSLTANTALGGRTYTLASGGTLVPA